MSGRLTGRVWLWPREAADLLGVSQYSVRRWLRDGTLPGRDLNAGTGRGPRWQVLASAVRQQTTGPSRSLVGGR